MEQEQTGLQRMLIEALDHLHAALDLLDRAAAPAHIGAHVDLAIHQLGAAAAPPFGLSQESPIKQAVVGS